MFIISQLLLYTTCIGHDFSSRCGPFLALLSTRRAGGDARTPRCWCNSRPSSVARALGYKSSETWQATAGMPSAQLYQAGQWNPPRKRTAAGFQNSLLYTSAGTSSGRLATLHLESGRLATSPPGSNPRPWCHDLDSRRELRGVHVYY